jgi:hypothetical protein
MDNVQINKIQRSTYSLSPKQMEKKTVLEKVTGIQD